MAERSIRPSWTAQDPVARADREELAGETRWRNGGRDSWWLTVLTHGYCAHARLRRSASGRWTGFASRLIHQGWLHDDEIDAGESLIEAMRTAERAIARLSASAW